ncbi:hypothetical protein IKF81_00065 [Candidatus Saccharibacteria bacterium]|nr:hypothetical protein [Candidatus Saccharibacteria bacterium]
MDREDLEKIKQLSANATKEITRLQEEISRYKSGADSFEEGVKILKNLAAMEQRNAEELEKVIRHIPELNTKKIRAEEERTRERINKIAEELEEFDRKAEKILEENEKQNREMRKEMRKIKEEILAEVKAKSRKGFRLFGKK